MTHVIALRRIGLVAVILVTAWLLQLAAAQAAFDRRAALELFPDADEAGELEGTPPVMPIRREGALIGWAFSSHAAVRSVGYSGKKLDLLIGLDLEGTITGVRILEQTEPIMVTGATGADLEAFARRFVGHSVTESISIEPEGDDDEREGSERSKDGDKREIDAVAGATITSLVINDAILGAARAVAASKGLIVSERIDLSARDGPDASLSELVRGGALVRLTVTAKDFAARLSAQGLRYPSSEAWSLTPETPVFELFAGIVTPPPIGRSLLGHQVYDRAMGERQPGEQLLFVGSRGLLSFKGTAWRQSGVFERLTLVQDEHTLTFGAEDHRAIDALAAAGAPELRERAVFTVRSGSPILSEQPFKLRVLIPAEALDGTPRPLAIDLAYALPETFALPDAEQAEPLWRQIWRDRIVEIVILAVALLGLTGLFFFQDWFARRARLMTVIRIGYLLFTLGFLGFHARAQLSVVNILSFANVLVEDFRWEYFLMEPLIFLLWVGVVVGLLFWGRGPFCGWLCPFGALQELLNRAAKLAKVPQVVVPWGIHVRLWPIKYVVFIGLLGYSLYSLADAERLAEIEPFKTAIVLQFMREWPFVVFAGGLLAIGLFVERAFCRYLCPLGAALAIPGKMRISEWLLRHKECGSPCQRCAQGCMVQAIHPEGHIDVNECLYCLHCQVLYYDDQRCPTMVLRRQRRERREALSSPSLVAGSADGTSKPKKSTPPS